MKRSAVYTQGPVGRGMLKTSLAMIPGTLSLSGYQLVDTYFIGQLTGDSPLAAMGFSMPAIMLIGCMFHGLSVGVNATTAQALGAQKHDRACRFVSGGLLLITIFSLALAVVGICTSQWIFARFGARGDTLKLVVEYMNIWYIGCMTASLAGAGNGILISVGAARWASAMMLGGMLLNAVLDPLCIFGWGIIPAGGIKGAAWATVLSQLCSTVTVLWLLSHRHKLLKFRRSMLDRWSKYSATILHYSLPATLGMLMMPIGMTVVTRVTAMFGDAAVAGATAGGRLETLAFVIPMSVGMTLTPFMAQNYGAKAYDRIRAGLRFACGFALFFLLLGALFFNILAPWLASIFCNSEESRAIMTSCLRIASWGYWGTEVHRFSGFCYTGCGKPGYAALLNGMRFVVFIIPLTLLAAWMHSLTGVFFARLISDVSCGTIGFLLAYRMTKHLGVPVSAKNRKTA